MAAFVYAIRIEGVGNSDGLYRWIWGRTMLDSPVTADPDSLYLTGLLRWPQQIEFGLDFKEAKARLGTASFELRRTETTASTFYRLRRSPVARFLGPPVNEIDTSITLDVPGLTGVLIWGREAVTILAEGPPATYLVDRGTLGTAARPHGDEASDDRELFDTHSAATISKRMVELLRIPMDSTGYADEERVWVGVLRGITSPDPGRIRIEADNSLTLVEDTDLMSQQWRGTIWSSLPESISAMGEQTAEQRGPDGGYAPGATKMVLATKDVAYVATWSRPPFANNVRLVYGSDLPFAQSPEYTEDDLPKTGDDVWEVLSSHEDQPPNAAVVAVNTLPLAQNPAILILQLLTSTDNGGVPGSNGPYDTGIANLAGNIPEEFVDVDGILAWAERIIGGILKDDGYVDCLHLGLEGKPEKLSDVIRAVLKPYGATLTQAEGGLISIAQLTDSLQYDETASTISQGQVLNIPQQNRRVWTAADKIQAEYNNRPGIGKDKLKVLDGIRLQRVPEGEHNSVSLDMGWTSLRPTAIQLAAGWLARWHEPIASISIQTNQDVDLWPGDSCTLTHSKVYAADGTLGITDELYLVESRKEGLTDAGHVFSYTLLYVGALYDTDPVQIAPSCEVISWNLGAQTITVESDTFVGPHPGGPTGPRDIGGFEPGDQIQLCDEFGALLDPVDLPMTILSVGLVNTIVLTGVPNTPPSNGDIVRMAPYGLSVATQQAQWVYISDPLNLLDGTDPPKEYRFA